MAALHAIRDAELHVVAQVVEPEFVVGAVGDIGGVTGTAILIADVMHDHPDAQTQSFIDAPHPIRVTAGQVVVDRDLVDTLAFQGVEVDGERRDQCLTFTGLHFGDLAAVQRDSTDQLRIEVPHIEDAATGFAHRGEGRDQKVVELRALRELFFEGDGLRGQVLIGHLLHARLHVIDRGDHGTHSLYFTFVLSAKNLGEDGIYTHSSVLQ